MPRADLYTKTGVTTDGAEERVTGTDIGTKRGLDVNVVGTSSGTENDTPVTANVSVTSSNITVLAANTSRLGATFYNDSATRAYLKFGATATTTDWTVALDQDDIFFLNPGDYSGIVDGITASGTATVRVTETT